MEASGQELLPVDQKAVLVTGKQNGAAIFTEGTI